MLNTGVASAMTFPSREREEEKDKKEDEEEGEGEEGNRHESVIFPTKNPPVSVKRKKEKRKKRPCVFLCFRRSRPS